MSYTRGTVTLMWLFIEGQTDPNLGAEKARGEAVGDYWYNLNTGSRVFLTAEDEVGSGQKTGRLRVWAIAPGGNSPVEVTRPLTGSDWLYVESQNQSKNYDGILKAAAAKLNEVLVPEGA
jgi:hypothetical protein